MLYIHTWVIYIHIHIGRATESLNKPLMSAFEANKQNHSEPGSNDPVKLQVQSLAETDHIGQNNPLNNPPE